MASGNCAQAGPLTLSLHDAATSAAGAVVRRARGFQGALCGGGAELLAGLSDVRRLAALHPECGYVLCMPVIPSAAGPRGAVLLGFAAAPVLGARRRAALAALCSGLGGALECAASEVFAVVGHLLGTPVLGAFCEDEEEDDEEEEASRGLCHGHRARGGSNGDGSGGWTPSQNALDSVPEGVELREQREGAGEDEGEQDVLLLPAVGECGSGAAVGAAASERPPSAPVPVLLVKQLPAELLPRPLLRPPPVELAYAAPAV